MVGDVGIDRYTIGTATRLSPEAPVPVVAVSSQTDKLGLAANVADNVNAFGAKAHLASVVGVDRRFEEMLNLLKKSAISSDKLVQHPSRCTSLKERVVAQNQQVVRIDHEITEPLNKEVEELFLQKMLPLVSKFDAVILEDYGKGLLTDRVARELIEAAKKANKLIMVDPTTVVRTPEIYRGVSVFKPNIVEAERLSRIEIRNEASLQKVGEFFLKELDTPIVIITQGKEGMTLFTRTGAPMKMPSFAKTVLDVSGAGDTVVSMLTLAMASGATLWEAALLANYAAAVEVSKRGTATVTMAELEEFMCANSGFISE